MKVSLKLERISPNDVYDRVPPCWVALITGRDDTYGLQRVFLQGNVDYSEANTIGSRYVYKYYILEQGFYYEVAAPESRHRGRRYFCTVVDDVIKEVPLAQVLAHLDMMEEAGLRYEALRWR